MELFLHFLQFNEINYFQLMEHLVDLTRAADKFDVKELMELCMEHTVNVENCAKMAQIAKLYDDKWILKQCKEVMIDHGKEVTETEAFKEIQNSDPNCLIELFKETLQ